MQANRTANPLTKFFLKLAKIFANRSAPRNACCHLGLTDRHVESAGHSFSRSTSQIGLEFAKQEATWVWRLFRDQKMERI